MKKSIVILLLLVGIALPARADFTLDFDAAPVDSAALNASTPCDTCCRGVSSFYWIKQLFDNGFSINAPDVCYPSFPRFALKVYNWGDKTFNSYDTDYVVGTGKNWKLQGKTYNWLETSTMIFPDQSLVNMHSDLYGDAGFSLSFMAVSIGYMWNINKLFSHPTNRRTFNIDFMCSRFSLSYQAVSSTGGMIITKFGDYNSGHSIHYRFDGASMSSKTLDGYWFFNNYKYSQGAAYSYSKYQLRNAGTALVGFNLTEQNIGMNFGSLPQEMLEHSPMSNLFYSNHYRSYNVLGGYAYNWALKPRRWLLNASAMVAVGYRRMADSESAVDTRSQLANNFRANLALVYNHRALFASLTVRAQGFLNYNTGNMTHFNSIVSFTGAVGMRF